MSVVLGSIYVVSFVFPREKYFECQAIMAISGNSHIQTRKIDFLNDMEKDECC